MKAHEQLRDDDRERAAQYLLEGLEPAAARLYEAHLAICPLCRAEVAMCRDTVEALGRAPAPVDPPPALKQRLMERIRSGARREEAAAVQAWKRWLPNVTEDASIIVRGGEADWQATAVEGVRVRRLFVDEAADRVTMLVRMDAGTSYPAHRHGGVEECFVLEGDIYGPDFEMNAGDYQRLAGGSTHGIQGTRTGCLLFIVSSMNDELLHDHA